MKSTPKICIITGATSGIGRETAIALAGMGIHLVLPVRNLFRGNELKQVITEETRSAKVDIMECDLASFVSIRAFVSVFLQKYKQLDLLINNAGVWESKHIKSDDGIELTFAVNHLAPFLMTNLLLDIIKKTPSARIINVSSEAHRISKINFSDLEGNRKWNSLRAYGQSKLASILFTQKLAKLLAPDKITVNCLHPGVVATKLFDSFPGFIVKLSSLFFASSEKGAQTTIYLATSHEVGNITGKYFIRKKIKKTSAAGNDPEVAEKLWKESIIMTKPDQNKFEKRSA